jgi:RNA polymerase sigma factor (sigma-70 family)
MALDERRQFVTALAASHGERLRRFLASRLRGAGRDVPDLAQEVYMRLWRIARPETIRNPEAYLFTIANHVLHQYTLRQAASPEPQPLPDTLMADEATDPMVEAGLQQRLEELDRALAQLPYKAQAALVLYRRDGYQLDEVAAQLGVSLAMVKKYLTKAILHCRQTMPADE